MLLSITDFIKYILLGLVQGITEPLPISSSGHLVIFKEIFNVTTQNELNFNIFVNFGSFLAIIFYYRNFLIQIISGAFSFVFKKDKTRKNDFLYCLYVVIATIPAGIAGILLKDFIDEKLSSLLTVGIGLFITGSLLIIVQKISKQATTEEITLKSSIFMGCAQIIGLVSGVSRSGSTSFAGVCNKVTLEKALRFSFMMYIPVSIGSMILGIKDFDVANTYLLGYIGAFLMSIIGTYFAIKVFFKLVKKDNLKYFGFYCLTVSIAILSYLVFK